MLAYSTVSQLGYMFMALGAGIGDVAQLAVVAAMFHLFTHAFFKALLFLAVGQRDARDGRRHRHAAVPRAAPPAPVHLLDVRRRRPGAWRDLPPFAGFFSKDEILAGLNQASHVAGQPAARGLGGGLRGRSTGSPS